MITMMLRVMCLFFVVGTPLTIRSSLRRLHYDVLLNIFDLLDYTSGHVRRSLSSLLGCKHYSFTRQYAESNLEDEQSTALGEYAVSEKTLWPVLFPVKLLNRNKILVEMIEPHLADLDLDRIDLAPNSHIDDEKAKILLMQLGPNPERCATEETALRAMNIGFWQLFGDFHLYRNLIQWSPIFNLILHSFHRSRLKTNIPIGNIQLYTELKRRFIIIKDQRDRWQWELRLMLRLLYTETKNLDVSRKGLWSSMLVLIPTRGIIAHPSYSIDRPKWLDLVGRIKPFFSHLLKRFPVHKIPLFTLEELFRSAVHFGFSNMNIEIPTATCEALDHLFPQYPCLTSSKAICISKWKYFLKPRQSYFEIPRGEISFFDLMLWWGRYKDLSQVIYFDPIFSRPLRVKIRNASILIINTIHELLDLMKTLQDKLYTILVQKSRHPPHLFFTKVISRTIACSMLYNHNIAFHLSREQLAWFGRPPRSGDPVIFEGLYQLICSQSRMNLFLPIKFLDPPHSFSRTFKVLVLSFLVIISMTQVF